MSENKKKANTYEKELKFKVKSCKFRAPSCKSLKRLKDQAKLGKNMIENNEYERMRDVRPFENTLKVCDLSGRKPLYCDPNTKLLYRDMEEFQQLQSLDLQTVKNYLLLRSTENNPNSI